MHMVRAQPKALFLLRTMPGMVNLRVAPHHSYGYAFSQNRKLPIAKTRFSIQKGF